jgi:hypothetical protein
MKFKMGDQIVFHPWHESGKEYGFVTGTTSNGSVACRFWSENNLGSMRTMANSELCNPKQLTKIGDAGNVPKEIVEAWLVYLGYIKKK